MPQPKPEPRLWEQGAVDLRGPLPSSDRGRAEVLANTFNICGFGTQPFFIQ